MDSTRRVAFGLLTIGLIVSAWVGIGLAQGTNRSKTALSQEGKTFRQPEKVSSPPSVLAGPVDAGEYRVGPGDAFEIVLKGPETITYLLEIDPEGNLSVPDIGVISLRGLTLRGARERIMETAARVAPALGVEVALKRVRSFRVWITGEVRDPGVFEVQATMRLSDLVELAGGFTDSASVRRIRMIGPSEPSREVDLLPFYRNGLLESNPALVDGAVVVVPRRGDTYGIYGAVEYQGEYEFVPGQKLTEAIEVAGGLTDRARTEEVEIWRMEGSGASARYHSFSVPLGRILEAEEEDLPLERDDRVYVRSVPEGEKSLQVRIDGEVLYPGFYAIKEGGEMLSSVVERAGGLTPRALLSGAAILRRQEPVGAGSDSSYLEMDLSRIALRKYLLLTVEHEFQGWKRVKADFVRLFRDGSEDADVRLADGDWIIIPQGSGYVQVLGEVVSPGYVAFEPGKGWKFFVERAGGFTRDADKGGVYVKRFSTAGTVPAKQVKYLHDGDVVMVTARKERDVWRLAREFVGFAAQVATIYIIILQAGK